MSKNAVVCTSITLPVEMAKRADDAAEKLGVPRVALIRLGLNKLLDDLKREGKEAAT